MRWIAVLLLAASWLGCSPPHRAAEDAGAPPADACPTCGTECGRQGKPETTISGTVFAPNGTLPLYGVSVYVPSHDPGAFTDGVACTRCEEGLPGDPMVKAVSDEFGKFTLGPVVAGEHVPLVITVGKWRRQIEVPVAACADNPLPPELTSLPRNKAEGDLPKIAVVTGGCDALECLIRKLGVDDAEFTPDSGDGRVHLFASNGASRNLANEPFAPASTLWGNIDKLKQYDIAMFGCECSQLAANKPLPAMQALKAYADAGGRAFLSHYNNIWISGENGNPGHAPPVWPQIASCNLESTPYGTGMIDLVGNPLGPAFADWMINVGGSMVRSWLPILDARRSCSSLDNSKAERWLYMQTASGQVVQSFQFTTPNEAPAKERCGKVVFSDMHVASGSESTPGMPFPLGCSTLPLAPQEKALAFMFFNIATCVGIF